MSSTPIFPPPGNPSFTFIDLFAGLGGFRLAMQSLGGKCVFSSEWDAYAQATYLTNFGEQPHGDITQSDVKEQIPSKFDVLCAGFPCQPFSKGGHQNGFDDTRGTLFFDICDIVQRHKPKYLLLENVANLVSHDKGNTYRVIAHSLNELGYVFPSKPVILSPDQFGVPALRPRLYIPCVRSDVAEHTATGFRNFSEHIMGRFVAQTSSIDRYIDLSINDRISAHEERILFAWDEFYKGIDIKVIGFPVWADYFMYDGDFSEFPKWKANFVAKNMELYQRNREFIDGWLLKFNNMAWCSPSNRKFEWQAGADYSSVFDCLIQFRTSGVRAKKPDKFSTLVAMNHRQVIGKLRRRISVEEAKLLQSFPKEYKLSEKPGIALRQLGNTVNVNVVAEVFSVMRGL